MKQCNVCGYVTEDYINVCPTCGNQIFTQITYQQQPYNFTPPPHQEQLHPAFQSISSRQPSKPKKKPKLPIVLPIFLAVMVIVITVAFFTLIKYRKSVPDQNIPASQVPESTENNDNIINYPDNYDNNNNDTSDSNKFDAKTLDELPKTFKHKTSELKEFSTEYRITASRNGYLIVTDNENGYGFMDGTGNFILPMEQRKISFVDNNDLDILKTNVRVSEKNTYYSAFIDFDGNEIARSENQGSVNGFYGSDTTAIICNPYSQVSKLIDCNGNVLKEFKPLDNGKLFTSIVGNKYLLTEYESMGIGQINGPDTITEVMGIYNLDGSPVYVPNTHSLIELCYNPSGYFAIFESPLDDANDSYSFFVIDETGEKIADLPAFRGTLENNFRVLDDDSFVVPAPPSDYDEDSSNGYCKIYNIRTNTLSENYFEFVKYMVDNRAFAYVPDAEAVCIIDNEGNITNTGAYLLSADDNVLYGALKSSQSNNTYSIMLPTEMSFCFLHDGELVSMGIFYFKYKDDSGQIIYMNYAGKVLYTADSDTDDPSATESDDETALFLTLARQDEATDTVYRDIIPVSVTE